ncbi:hypothetical protein CWC46_14275 [Prodigiosinella confusarubida]|uniref:Uncharacterized protein n=1 Tax=Serratia sp. (strain ATCC 39006) TaxID=104623 RepID=A0A2I5T8I0_SERS3|nr:hypothetical protein [Serratia sp. ATCC 39006]AUH00871.1 hypothetical protein CWC46_14275 [Serratia sp. ATCC 39006]AUH05193.1 hypothetical protein Ser39006_014280 [Serratia sp. ATCC 39006]
MDTDIISYESMLAAEETAKWTYWIMVATGFTGVATFMAVLTSLYLASRKPKALITASISYYSKDRMPHGTSVGIVISVANIGDIPIFLKSIHWSCGTKFTIVQIFNPTNSDPFPRKLGVGDSASYYLEFNENCLASTFIENVEKHGREISKLCFNVKTGTGKVFKFKVDKDTIKSIKIEACR